MTSLKNQRAELRAVIAHQGRYALVGSVNVNGADIYCSVTDNHDGPRRERFRTSYHESGASRMHVSSHGGTLTFAHQVPQIPPQELTGALLIAQGGPVIYPQNYDYRPKADSPRRRTLSILPNEVKHGVCVEYWAFNPTHPRGLDIVLRNVTEDSKVAGFVMADRVKPCVLIVVRTMVEAERPELQAAIDRMVVDGEVPFPEGEVPPTIPSLVAWPSRSMELHR